MVADQLSGAELDASREAFEAWLSDDGKWPAAVERDRHGNYRLAQAANAWPIWQAAEARGMERAALIVDAKAREWNNRNGIAANFCRDMAAAIREAI